MEKESSHTLVYIKCPKKFNYKTIFYESNFPMQVVFECKQFSIKKVILRWIVFHFQGVIDFFFFGMCGYV
jgi:hypothetical protein